MQEQNQQPQPKQSEQEQERSEEEEDWVKAEDIPEPLAQQIEREVARLDPDPLKKLKKRINKLYGWIWALLGLVALLFIIFLLVR